MASARRAIESAENAASTLACLAALRDLLASSIAALCSADMSRFLASLLLRRLWDALILARVSGVC